MSSNEEKILKILVEDLQRLEDVHACMVARKGLEGIVPPMTDKFREEIVEIWDVLKNTMDDFFDIISKYSRYGLDKVYFELGRYDAIFFTIRGSDTALVAIVPALANRGLLEVELENARRKITEILDAK